LRARWEHIDFDKAEWFIPEENSKTTAWTVPFVPAVIKLFQELQDIAGDSPWVLASQTTKPGREARHIDQRTLGHAFRRLFDIKHKDPHTGEKNPCWISPAAPRTTSGAPCAPTWTT
jgi:integrase